MIGLWGRRNLKKFWNPNGAVFKNTWGSLSNMLAGRQILPVRQVAVKSEQAVRAVPDLSVLGLNFDAASKFSGKLHSRRASMDCVRAMGVKWVMDRQPSHKNSVEFTNLPNLSGVGPAVSQRLR